LAGVGQPCPLADATRGEARRRGARARHHSGELGAGRHDVAEGAGPDRHGPLGEEGGDLGLGHPTREDLDDARPQHTAPSVDGPVLGGVDEGGGEGDGEGREHDDADGAERGPRVTRDAPRRDQPGHPPADAGDAAPGEQAQPGSDGHEADDREDDEQRRQVAEGLACVAVDDPAQRRDGEQAADAGGERQRAPGRRRRTAAMPA
jgi:hypothetical protein